MTCDKDKEILKAKEIMVVLEDRITSGALQSGGRIKEKDLADEFKISRGLIREVLIALQREGLIELIPNKGATVNQLSTKEALDLYDIRAGLAHTAGRLVPNCISDEQINELEEMHSQMALSISENDSKAFYKINAEFHTLLFEVTRNSALIEMNQTVERRLSLYLHKEIFSSAILKKSNHQHFEILERISNGDSDGAAHELESHVLMGRNRIIQNAFR